MAKREEVTVLGVVPQTPTAEVRVVRRTVKGRACIDVRTWWLPDGQTEFVPSRKGICIDVRKAGTLAEALARA